MKIRPVGVQLLQTDWRTDMTKLKVISRNFSNAPTNNYIWYRFRPRRRIINSLFGYLRTWANCRKTRHLIWTT